MELYKEIAEGIKTGDSRYLSRAITLAESTLESHRLTAGKILEECFEGSANSFRIGITGAPGVGKSSFIEAVGKAIINEGKKVAVLAIDPTSEKTKGSILGDKTRMEELANNPDAFVRPSPSSCYSGGVNRFTREAIVLCEAAGYEVILIETVGVGQSEINVHSMSDMLVNIMVQGTGDQLQGIKRGILEIANLVIFNKADGNNRSASESASQELKQVIPLFPETVPGWKTRVMTCSALEGSGIKEAWNFIKQYFEIIEKNKFRKTNRRNQLKYWFNETIYENLKKEFHNNKKVAGLLKATEKKILSGQLSVIKGAENLLSEFFQRRK